MISPFAITPKPKNKLAKRMWTASLISMFVFIVAAAFGGGLQRCFTTAALISMTVAIYVYSRHMATVYVYEVMFDEGETPLFVVSQRQRVRTDILCRVSLASIKDVRKIARDEIKSIKGKKEAPLYRYYPTMCPDELYLVSIRSEDECADIFTELTDEAATLLLRYCEEVKYNM